MPTNTGIHQQETLSYTLVDSSADGWRIDPWNMVTKASILMVIIPSRRIADYSAKSPKTTGARDVVFAV